VKIFVLTMEYILCFIIIILYIYIYILHIFINIILFLLISIVITNNLIMEWKWRLFEKKKTYILVVFAALPRHNSRLDLT